MVIRKLASGVLDLETSQYLVGAGDYPYALNVTSSVTDGSFKPIPGNRIADYTLPIGTNTVIGFKEDLIRDRAFYFVHNSNLQHSILIFNKADRSVVKLIEDVTDTGGLNILNFEVETKILHIDILYRDPSEGDILSWSAGNASPKELLIDKVLNGDYGVILEEYIEAAKRPPLAPPSADYVNDGTRTVNSMRRKLFQFKYRWVYDDFSKSTWGPASKMPLPDGLFANPDLDNDPGYNNAIDISVNTGNVKVTHIEIAGRVSNGDTWGDYFLVDSINKSDINITDNTVYIYRFFNDAVYPYIDINESNLLFDWVPQIAKGQVLANGNVKVYGNILEGYDRVEDLSISVTAELVSNDSGVVAGPPTIRWVGGSDPGGMNDGYLEITGTPGTGTRYVVLWRATQTSPPTVFMDYTSVPGDTNTSIAAALGAQQPSYVTSTAGNLVNIVLLTNQTIFYTSVSGGGASGGSSTGYEGTWNWWSRYLIGVVYFDEQGRTNGVHVDRTIGRDNSDVSTPPYTLVSGIGQTPALEVAINHNPPSWAKTYQIVRSRNLSIGDFLFWKTDQIASDAEFYYFSIQTLFTRRDAQQSYVPNWEFVEGDRVRIAIDNIGASQTIPGTDYLVVGIEEKEFSGTGVKKYVKVRKPKTAPPTYTGSMLLQLWRPSVTGGQVANEVFYEFGEAYPIYDDGGTLRHRGGTQDQTGVQPAIVFLREGDVFYRKRTFVSNDELYITDANYSDDYKSAVNSNGRPQAIDFNAKATWYPTMVRFGGSYQTGTSINDLPRFYFDDLDEYDRQFGSIQKMRITDRYMRVFQELKCGRVPVFQQVIKDAVGGDVLAQSNKLLNNIQYYQGDFGIGRHPESHSGYGFSDYFVDTNRGAVCRLSMDGLTPLSVVHKANNYFVQNLKGLTDTDFVYGGFDATENRYILSISSKSVTIAFNEQNRGFEAFHSYTPEFIGNIGTLFITAKNGYLWTHDSTTYANFYGVQYPVLVDLVFNEAPMVKKTWQAVTYIAGSKWYVDDVTTSLGKKSKVPLSYFKKREDGYHAPMLRDMGSPGGLTSGAMLKGNWAVLRFKKDNPAGGEEFHYGELKYSLSNLNSR